MKSPWVCSAELFLISAACRPAPAPLKLLLDAEGIGGGARPETPQGMAIALAPAAADDRPHGQTRRMRVMPPFDAVTPGINGWRASTAAASRWACAGPGVCPGRLSCLRGGFRRQRSRRRGPR